MQASTNSVAPNKPVVTLLIFGMVYNVIGLITKILF